MISDAWRTSAVPAVMALGAALAAAAHAGVVMPTEQSAIRFNAWDSPYVISGGVGSYAWMLWVRPSALPATPAHVLDGPGVLEMLVDPAGPDLVVRLENGGDTLELTLPFVGAMPIDEWVLLAASWDPGTGTLQAWTRAQGLPPQSAAIVDTGFDTIVLTGPLSVGRPDEPGAVTLTGHYGALVFRDHAIGAADVDLVFDARDYVGAYRLDNTAAGGALNGPTGVNWMAQHAILSKPVNTNNPAAVPAVVGGVVNMNNYPIYDAFLGGSTVLTAGSVATVTDGADAPTWASPFEDAFFVRQVPYVNIPDPNLVVGVSPILRRLVCGEPRGLVKCVVSANSRGVNNADACEQTLPENHAHGFIEAQLPIVAGVLNRPAWIYQNRTWFGFDTTSVPRTTGVVTNVTDPGGPMAFKRLWTGSGPATGGPGLGVILDENATYALKCRPEPGSLLIAEAPLVVRTHLLRFPGAGAVSWRPVQASGQSAPGSLGPATQVDLDTGATFVHTLCCTDFVNLFQGTITLEGDFADQIQVGDACFVGAGAGSPSFSVVESVQLVDDRTDIQLEHPFGDPLSIGSVLHFGPWGIETIEHEWPALAPGDPEPWRGLELTAVGGTIVDFAWDAWRPNVDGVAYGIAGWGGNGYTPQIDESFDDAIPLWIEALGPQVWLQAFAQQDSSQQSMCDMLDIIRATLPATEVAWIGDGAHFATAWAGWHQYLMSEAAAAGVVAATVVRDPAIGAYLDQAADGMREDANHWSHRGNVRLAERWLDMLGDAIRASGDVDGDGFVDVNDLVAVIASWGPCPPVPAACPADADGDGFVDVNDLVQVIMDWDG